MSALNSAQHAAVCYFDGPSLILAGAGSGKTRVITQKIAFLIEEKGFEPKHIAALTFTNKAANEMRERIKQLLQDKTLTTPGKVGRKVPVNQLNVCTFHSLGVQILRQEADAIGLKPQFSILDAADCSALIQEQIATTDRGLIKRIQSQISLWKNALLPPDKALAMATDEDMQQAAIVYRQYTNTLNAYQAVDFDDLIRLPAETFLNHEAICEKWHNRLQYLLVDEYQDTNACQYQLLKCLTGKRAAFTVVGDDDQAIYGWRGATLDNLKQLEIDFPQLHVIKLEQNYRSCIHILNAANQVIANNPKLYEKKLWSEHGMGDAVTTSIAEDEENEAELTMFKISAHRFERRAQWRDYAILYRSNSQARVIEQVLRRERIPYILSGGQSFFEKAEIKDICAYLRLISNTNDDPAFIRAITTPKRGVGSTTLETLGLFSGKAKVSLFDASYMGGIINLIHAKQLAALTHFCDFIQYISGRVHKQSAALLLDELLAEIHYENYLYDVFDERTALSKWQNVQEFINWLKMKGTKAAPALSENEAYLENIEQVAHDDEGKNLLELIQTVTLMSMLEGKESNPDAIRLSTIHAAKGLEYPHVFLVGCEEGILPHHATAEEDYPTAEKIEEERRLMYVAITRAKRSLHVSWCKKRRRSRETIVCEASRFINEMNLAELATLPIEEKPISPKNRLASLQALLTD